MENGYSPSIREMCQGLGLASPGSLFKHLRSLEAEGVLIRTPGQKRSWRLAGGAPQATIPVIGRIAAGEPILAEENWEEEVPVDPAMFGFPNCFAVRVKGDSMVEAYIGDGDLAVIRPQDHAESGQIVAALVDGLESEATLKTFYRTENEIQLRPANRHYEPIVFTGPDMAKVTIVGKLVGVIRTVI